MVVRKTVRPAPDHISAMQLDGRHEDALVLLPDTLSAVDGQMVAGFREGAQALRVRAKHEGVPVEVVVPEGTRPGHYSEHAADWVLPLILGMPSMVVGGLITNEIQRLIDEWRAEGRSRIPTLRYREVVVDDVTRKATLRSSRDPPTRWRIGSPGGPHSMWTPTRKRKNGSGPKARKGRRDAHRRLRGLLRAAALGACSRAGGASSAI